MGIDKSLTNQESNESGKLPLVQATIYQDRLYNEYMWSVTSVDTLLGLIGGFVGLLWSIITWSLGGYESFRFTQEIISEIYSTTDKSRMMQGQEPTNFEEAHSDLTHCVETQARYDYTYHEFLSSSLIRCLFSCCFKRLKCYRTRVKRLQRHEAALE